MRILVGLLCLWGVLAAEGCRLTLQEAEQVALSSNNRVLAMQQLVAEARAGKLEALSAWFPQVQYISRGYQTEKWQPGANANSAFLSQFNTTQQILSTTKYYDVKISGLHVELMQRLLDAVIIDVLYDIRSTYYQVILDQETVATAVENVELFTSLAERAEADWRIGTSILLNFNQAKVAVANATAVYYQAVKQLKLDSDVLVRVLGYDPGSIEITLAESEIPVMAIPGIGEKLGRAEEVFAAEALKGLIFKPGFPESEGQVMDALFSEGEVAYWESTALTYQPTLQSVGTEVKIARTHIRKMRGKYAPEIHLEGNYGGYATRMLDNPSSNFFNQKYHGAIGFQLSWTVFDGGGREQRVCKALYSRRAKQFEYKRAVQRAYEQVRGQIFEIEEATSSLVTAESNVRLAAQTVELAQDQLNIGYLTIFDYQSVVDAYIQALNIRNEARYDLIKGYYGLRHVSGVDLTGLPCANRRQF